MSQDDRSLNDMEMEEALAADDADTQRAYLIKKVAKMSNRLDNGLSEKVERNVEFRKKCHKWAIRIAIILGPPFLTGVGFLINRVYL